MLKLDDFLKYYIATKIRSDSFWASVQVYYSGVTVPGEGEHKILDFIRSLKKSATFSPDLAHLIHGNDADLVMLCFGLHLPNVVIMREFMSFDKFRLI